MEGGVLMPNGLELGSSSSKDWRLMVLTNGGSSKRLCGCGDKDSCVLIEGISLALDLSVGPQGRQSAAPLT